MTDRRASPKVLVANRGEIAVRVLRACRELGLPTVAVYSDCDRDALHVRLADEAHHLGPSPAADSYLNIHRLLGVAHRSRATLVHPGYGFLAENAGFAAACVTAGLTFVGPAASVIERMGGKTSAREAAVAAGVPIVPGTIEPIDAATPTADILAAAENVGYPLLVKAVAGGGGKGMRAVSRREDLAGAVALARSEAGAAFGNSAIYLERRLAEPRHIEIQLLADHHGTILPFVERECSIQRRHQKVVEESPSPVLDRSTREAMADAAVRVAKLVGYTNAGTIEFLLDTAGNFYFLEMNTRLQVEHPVTEMVTGIDLVQWQLRVALGERLTIERVQAITPRGHAIECRIYAEDPDRGFMPAPGMVRALSVPGGPGVRDDRGVAAGFDVPTFYDSLLSKLVVWGETRPEAIARLARVLDEYRVVGLSTTLPFFRWLVRQPAFANGQFSTTYLDEILAQQASPFVPPSDEDTHDALTAAAIAAWLRAHRAGVAATSDQQRWRSIARHESLR